MLLTRFTNSIVNNINIVNDVTGSNNYILDSMIYQYWLYRIDAIGVISIVKLLLIA